MRLLERHMEGREWDVVVIEAGESLNVDPTGRSFLPRLYTPDALREAAPRFAGRPVQVYAYGDLYDHRTDAMVDAHPAVPLGDSFGFLRAHPPELRPRFDESVGPRGAIVARMVVREDRPDVVAMLRAAHEAGADLGFSIDAQGDGGVNLHEGKRAWVVTKIHAVDSLDLVSHPAAGGRVFRMVASFGDVAVLKLLDLIKTRRPAWLVGFDLSRVTEATAADTIAQVFDKAKAVTSAALKESAAGTERFAEMAVDAAVIEQAVAMLDAGDVDGARVALEQALAMDDTPPAEEAPVTENEKRHTEAAPAADLSAALAPMYRMMLDNTLSASDLPEPAQKRIRESFAGKAFEADALEDAIRSERDYLANVAPAGLTVPGLKEAGNKNARVSVGTEERDRWSAAIDGWFEQRPQEVDGERYQFQTIHEALSTCAGYHPRATNRQRMLQMALAMALPAGPLVSEEPWRSSGLREAASEDRKRRFAEAARINEATNQVSTFAELLGDSIARQLIKAYELASLPDWKRLVTIQSAPDYRTRRFIRTSGIEDLPVVAENAVYPEHDLLSDEEATITPAKRGNLLYISREAMLQDDLDDLRTLPRKVGIAGARTIMKLVFNTNLSDNPTLSYDSTALIAAGHSNNQTAALSDTVLQEMIRQMEAQTGFGDGEILGGILRPKFLVVSPTDRKVAWKLLASEMNVEDAAASVDTPNFFKQYGMELFVNHYQTDLDASFVIADPAVAQALVVVFVDGIEEPQLFTADAENLGAMFTADRLGFKWRLEVGAGVVDHRPIAGSIPA